MCEIHRLTTNTCLTQVLIFKYHKVMNKIPLSGFCLLLKSRHKHLFRIMRITYMLLFAAIFCLHAENAISQKITLQGDNLSLKDYLNTIEKQTDYLFIYDALFYDFTSRGCYHPRFIWSSYHLTRPSPSQYSSGFIHDYSL